MGLRLLRGTASAWTSANPTLGAMEQGFETDTGLGKLGDGSTTWNDLPYTVYPIVVSDTAPDNTNALWVDTT